MTEVQDPLEAVNFRAGQEAAAPVIQLAKQAGQGRGRLQILRIYSGLAQ
jgi:hypothetical protein